MDFRIADTFTDSLTKLTNQEQKSVKTTAFDLQLNPSHPGLQFHKLDRAQDPNFASVRVSRDIRLIIHRTKNSILLCYVGHHDDAYQWAERRKLETHPKTGAAQFVEIREKFEEVIIPTYVTEERPKPPLFEDYSDDELLLYGVPPEWLADVRMANEDSVLDLTDHLPYEASEALLELAVGEKPAIPDWMTAVEQPLAVGEPEVSYQLDPFDHPDALRRFRVIENLEDLERALDYPWEKWTIFLHPEQQKIVEGDYSGPARVSGSAGTGKTVVALHRAVYLAKTNPDARVLLATFSETLANALEVKLRRLIHSKPRLADQIEVYDLNSIGKRLYQKNIGEVRIASKETIAELIRTASKQLEDHRFSQYFLMTEWEQVVDAWQLETWEEYRNVLRLGRKTRLPENRRIILWSIFEQVRTDLQAMKLVTYPGLFSRLAEHYEDGSHSPYDFIVIDESQDVSVSQMKFLAALGANEPNSLFFAGDLGQRIFQQPFSWKALGVDIRGRSRTLRINYRTSHQIRKQADKLLGPELADVDGNTEERTGTISVFNGPIPSIERFDTRKDEIEAVSQWLKDQISEGLLPEEIGVFVRTANELPRAQSAIELAELSYKVLDEKISTTGDTVSLCTMHLAKGLEFRAVAVMACDDEVIPLQDRIERVIDESDLEDVYNTERHLLYVACTRARDHLLVTSVEPASEFLDDLVM
jgi:superfamily I DNA/RNA helicase/mRNA-degrading endonuclease RelE of RelBE toxin-antitoxin system